MKFHATGTARVKMVGHVMEPCWNISVPVRKDLQEPIAKVLLIYYFI